MLLSLKGSIKARSLNSRFLRDVRNTMQASRMARLMRAKSDVANARLMWAAISSRLESGPMTGLMSFLDNYSLNKKGQLCSRPFSSII